MTNIVHTLGDSTLDNLYWMLENVDLKTAKKRSVEGVLREKGHTVISHAYDGFTTRSVLGQDTIGAVLPNGPAKEVYLKEKATKGEGIASLSELKKKISEKPNATHFVVISVGGNDFRVNLGNPWALTVKEAFAVGVGLDVRMTTELIIAKMLLVANAINTTLYTALIAASSISMLTVPFLFSLIVEKWDKEIRKRK